MCKSPPKPTNQTQTQMWTRRKASEQRRAPPPPNLAFLFFFQTDINCKVAPALSPSTFLPRPRDLLIVKGLLLLRVSTHQESHTTHARGLGGFRGGERKKRRMGPRQRERERQKIEKRDRGSLLEPAAREPRGWGEARENFLYKKPATTMLQKQSSINNGGCFCFCCAATSRRANNSSQASINGNTTKTATQEEPFLCCSSSSSLSLSQIAQKDCTLQRAF